MNKPRPKKSLGQNFLKSKEALQLILAAADLNKSKDKVLEIGPGEGALTFPLAQNSSQVIAIEKDDFLSEELKKTAPQNVKIIHGDVLELNLPQLLEENDFGDYKVVANIPYYITGKLLRLLLELENKPKICVLLLQKEVAERICQKAPKMSILSLSVQFYGQPEIIADVSKEDFYPVPKVDSAILKITVLDPKKLPPKEEIKKFFKLIKVGFSSPRKTLINNLANGLSKSKEEIADIVEKLGLDLNTRAQELGVDDWKKLSSILKT